MKIQATGYVDGSGVGSGENRDGLQVFRLKERAGIKQEDYGRTNFFEGSGVRVWFLDFLNFSCLLETHVEMSRNQLIQGDRSLRFRGEVHVGAVD